ncbi:MAG: hypothetical protein K5694_04765 [Bacilli bacterium]|nr:hypothetical protein [Bacilli bacterium]
MNATVPFIVTFLLAIVNATLMDNVVLIRFYGICSFVGVSNKVKPAFSMGVAVAFVTIFASLVCWPLYNFVLVPAGIPFMDTVVYILVIASLVQLVGLVIKKYSPALYKAFGIYLPLITTNCAVLGVAQGNTDSGLSFGLSMAQAIGTSAGFLIIIFLMACIRSRLDAMNVPKAFKGIPIALIVAGIMSIALIGLGGIGS